jgi:hypothetical protein
MHASFMVTVNQQGEVLMNGNKHKTLVHSINNERTVGSLIHSSLIFMEIQFPISANSLNFLPHHHPINQP